MKTAEIFNHFLLKQADASERMVFAFNKNAEFIYFNQVWLDYRISLLDGELQAPWNGIHPDDRNVFQADLAAFCGCPEPVEVECRVYGGDGVHTWFRFILASLYTPEGEFIGGIAYGRDITIKKQEENARLFAAVIASPTVGIILKDSEGRITHWNAGSQNIMGYTPEEMLGRTSDSYTYHSNFEAIAKINHRLMEGEIISFTRTEVNHKSGRKIICSTTFVPIFGIAGDVTGSVVIFHDVTAEKLAEEKRLQAEAELRKSYRDITALLNEMPAPTCVTNEISGSILGCNPSFATMCASAEEAVIGSPMTRYFQRKDADGQDSSEDIMNALRTETTLACNLHKMDGNTADVEIMGRPFFYQEQKSVVIYCRDLTRQRRQEQSLREAALAAQEASQMKTTFLANMSHEIRTPLNGVIGFAELALDEPSISPTVSGYLNKIKISANGLLEIINDVLDISKIEAGKIELENVPFSLHDILQICETIIGPKAEEKNVTLYLYAEPLVNRKLVGDQMRLRQILLNLLSNAVKFTNVGIVKLMSNVEERAGDKIAVSFEVKDSGIGMTPDQVRKIFDPFTQADGSTTRKYGGTGLGLTITKNLIELMGGTLRVESAPGIGSKFSFSLVLDTVADGVLLPQEEIAQQSLCDKPQFAGEVLVCEDNAINQQVIQEHLAKVGLQAEIVPNGKLGVEQVKNRMNEGRSFDLIFMDIHMPVMDGLEATQKLLESGVTTPIVALTANAMSSDKKNYLSQGMADYLSKPFRAHELWECLLRHLKPLNMSNFKVLNHSTPQMPDAFAPIVPPEEPPVALEPSETATVIDRVQGIENAAGNTALYNRLLMNFLEDNKDAFARFCGALESGNHNLALRMAHTMKSVAAMIGAMELADIARNCEAALNAGKIAAVKAQLPTLRAALGAVVGELVRIQEKEEKTSGCAPATHLDTEQARDLCRRLAPLLHNANSDSLEYLEAINTILAPLGEKAHRLAEQISDYDFDLAISTLDEIHACLEVEHA